MFVRDLFFYIFLCFIVGLIFQPGGFALDTLDTKAEKAKKFYNDALMESDLSQKESLLKKAHDLNPADGKISFLFAKTLLKRKKDFEAKRVFDKASQDPKLKVRVYRYLGEYYYRKKDYFNANFYYKKLVALNKTEDSYLNNYRLGEINGKKLNNYRGAIKYYLKAYDLRRFKDNHDILLLIAENYYQLNEYKEAIKFLKRYPHTNRNNQKAYKLLISSYEKSNNKKELEHHLSKYLKVWPYDRWAHRVAKKSGIKSVDVGSSDYIK